MKLLRMQATFGKLDGDVLELKDGLHVIAADNEAGKSTWCAFLLAMLYGIDTTQRSSKDTIADKTLYQSWNGKPMAGRLDLEWQGRRITIERSAKGKTPFGTFRAYETDTGIPVRELDALNCGETLTGVSRSVFERSAFVRQGGQAVSFNAALEQQLQELVTTGDAQTSGQAALQQLQQLKNRCQHHKTGLIPEVESKLTQCQETLGQMALLQQEIERAEAELAACRTADRELTASQDARNQQALTEAKLQWEQSQTECQQLERRLASLPTENQLDTWQEKIRAALEHKTEPIEAPLAPPALQGMTPPEAAAAARRDSEAVRELESLRAPRLWIRLLPLLLLIGAAVLRENLWAVLLWGGLGIGLTVLLLLIWLGQNKKYQNKLTELNTLLHKYQVESAEQMMRQARDYLQQLRAWQERQERGDVKTQAVQQALLDEISAVLPVTQLSEATAVLQQARLDRMKYKSAQQRSQTDQRHYEQLAAAIGPVTPVDSERTRELDRELAELRGRRDALGVKSELEEEQTALSQRLGQLRDYNAAIELAIAAMQQANQALQARFAPPLRQLAMAYLQRLTGGAHGELTVDRQMQTTLRDAGEPVGHASGYYSRGTRDQIWLALRLAIAELLLKQDCPVILDDALVYFDDARLRCALELLQEVAQKRQVLLFSCQTREQRCLEETAK